MEVEPLNQVLDFLDGHLFLQATVLYAKRDKTRMCRVINWGVELASSATSVLQAADAFGCFFSRLFRAGICKSAFCSFDGSRGFQDEYELQCQLHLFVGLCQSLRLKDLAEQLGYYFCCYLKSKLSSIPLLSGSRRSSRQTEDQTRRLAGEPAQAASDAVPPFPRAYTLRP